MPNPFAHLELTTDPEKLDAAKKFYSKVFGWKLTDLPGMGYTMIDVGGGTGGGMQAKPNEMAPTGWMPYVHVESVKTMVAKATKAGATAVLPFQEIGDMGAIGVLADPNGAMIGVWEQGKAQPAAVEAKPAAAKKSAKKTAPKKAPPPAKKASPKAASKPAASAAAKKAPAKKAPPAAAKKKPKKA
jgi:uncharacterized protein